MNARGDSPHYRIVLPLPFLRCVKAWSEGVPVVRYFEVSSEIESGCKFMDGGLRFNVNCTGYRWVCHF